MAEGVLIPLLEVSTMCPHIYLKTPVPLLVNCIINNITWRANLVQIRVQTPECGSAFWIWIPMTLKIYMVTFLSKIRYISDKIFMNIRYKFFQKYEPIRRTCAISQR